MTVRFNLRLLYACWHHLVSCTNGSAHDSMLDGMPQATGPTTEPRARMRLATTYLIFQAPPLPSTQSGQPPPPTRTESTCGHRSGKAYEQSLVRTCSRFRVNSTRTWRFALTISHINTQMFLPQPQASCSHEGYVHIIPTACRTHDVSCDALTLDTSPLHSLFWYKTLLKPKTGHCVPVSARSALGRGSHLRAAPRGPLGLPGSGASPEGSLSAHGRGLLP